MTTRPIRLLIINSLVILSIALSLFKGSTSIAWVQLFSHGYSPSDMIFFELRLPRTVTAFVSGGLLALAGSLIQLLLQNPLADPYVLGISSGAAFGTLLMILLGASSAAILTGAWAGSLTSMLLLLSLAARHRFSSHGLLLTGIAIAGALSAGISLILLLSPDTRLHSMLFWLTGDLSGASFSLPGLGILTAGLALSWLIAPSLNLLARGDLQASALGLSVTRYRFLLYLLSSLLTATAVTLAGCIGFIGLIVPHLTRRLIGFDHRYMLPASVMLGGGLLTFADTLARSLFSPEQIPVGIVMTLIGVPVFIGLLRT